MKNLHLSFGQKLNPNTHVAKLVDLMRYNAVLSQTCFSTLVTFSETIATYGF